ncbi:MAG: hypothetical protein RL702_1836 [Pseudomonadota bacterium]|jgi:sterol desaturase/sphingolipid hydroxylase (fatty acid hydroxylase superfamily)
MSPQSWILLAAAALLVIELAQGRHRGVHRLQDFCIIAASIASSFVVRPLMAFLTALVIGFALPQGKGLFADAPFWPSFAVLLISAEFAQYWVHRWAHNSNRHPLLYGMHRTHHTAPYVNVTLLYRSNLCWAFIHPYGWLSALAIYLGQAQAAVLFYLSIMLWNTLTHSDWRWDETIINRMPGGIHVVTAFELLFITPRIHHAHHGYGRDGTAYRNFNTLLSVFDRLFGTLYVPKARPWRYGVPGGEHHWVRQMLFPLVPLGAAVRRDKLGRTIRE